MDWMVEVYFFFDFFHFQKKYKPTPDRIYNPMAKNIGLTASPKKYVMIRISVVLISEIKNKYYYFYNKVS